MQAQMLIPIVQEFRPDILHTTTNFQNALVTDAVSRATGLPWVYEMRGNMEQTWVARQREERQESAKNSERYRLMRDRETEMARRADSVIVLSDVQRQDLISRGVPADKITIVPNSVDEDLLRIPRDPKGARRSLGLSEDGFWVGSVTSVVDYEGLPTLVRAVDLLLREGIDIRCAIVGDGVALPDLKKLIHELGLENRIVTPGRVPRDEALTWYQSLDLFTIPRIDTKVTRMVTPVKGLDAMALGVPLVMSKLPALTEIGTGSGQGLSFPPEDAESLSSTLAAIHDSPPLRTKMAMAGRLAAGDLTWSAAAEAVRTVADGLLQT